eukprot:TRINITY_DN51506_c0_g1_i2.p1 TRINITY_DN51506_c0_g1~~TRINITY_DN51506_c0_g1_i2.p1  ORF type:complete len:382 (-),score=66.93 TRINITY_DN51506_c0_g1_i2:264-1409(-)
MARVAADAAGARWGQNGDVNLLLGQQRRQAYHELLGLPAPSFAEKVLYGFSMVMHKLVTLLGCVLLVQATQAVVVMDIPLDTTGAYYAVLVLAGNFLKPFTDMNAELPGLPDDPMEAMDVSVAGFWVPMLLGWLLMTFGTLAHMSMTYRNLAAVVPYALLAVLFLTWQMELHQALGEIAQSEDVHIRDDRAVLEPAQSRQVMIYNYTQAAFVQAYNGANCQSTLPASSAGDQTIQLTCKKDVVEAAALEVGVQALCRPFTEDRDVREDFVRRSEQCVALGRRLQTLMRFPNIGRLENVYCRCRTAMMDWLRMFSAGMLFGWIFELLATCGVLYFSVEVNLKRLAAKERTEILTFLALGLVGLVLRATVFRDGIDIDSAASL